MKTSNALSPSLWVAAQAGGSLFLASSAWMVSGLTSSPLVNSLIPVVAAIPILINTKETISGYWLQISSVLTLLIASWFYSESGINQSLLLAISFVAIFAYSLGLEISTLPLQKSLTSDSPTRFKNLQVCTEVGSLIGAIMTALIFPAVSQFIPAFLLILPLTSIVFRTTRGGSLLTHTTTSNTPSADKTTLDPLCILQGFVVGGLFAVLALWVREIEGGKCFDFGVILAAYFIGKALTSIAPRLSLSLKYLTIFFALVICQLTTDGWISTLLFVPIGMFVNSIDLSLASTLADKSQPIEGWKSFQDQSALGGIAGGLALGSLCTLIGLKYAFPVICIGFISLSILSSRIRRTARST